jgi:catalase
VDVDVAEARRFELTSDALDRIPRWELEGLYFGILASVYSNQSMAQAAILSKQFSELGLFVSVVAETLVPGINLTYSAADAIDFDGLVVTPGWEGIFMNGTSPLYLLGRPLEILQTAYVFGKPVGALGRLQ